MRGMMILGVIAGLAAAPAMAGERTGFASIRAGDLPSAERMLVAERRIYPNRPELMLNLAAVYQQTGRSMAAASLYRDVLARPAVTMDMPNGAVRSSHQVADQALVNLAPTAIATR
ncbi:MAG: tetratricopeptide repeat protein [Sphingomonas sp.]|jgi:hypothetical protein|nr:MAG: tetratricopeptide repeat protein [Sphingomonas sp.]